MDLQKLILRINWISTEKILVHSKVYQEIQKQVYVSQMHFNFNFEDPHNRPSQDEDGHQLAHLQPELDRPDQHSVQQHLQLHLHEEPVRFSLLQLMSYRDAPRNWIFGVLFCRLTAFMTHLSIVASVLTMAAIAGERLPR